VAGRTVERSSAERTSAELTAPRGAREAQGGAGKGPSFRGSRLHLRGGGPGRATPAADDLRGGVGLRCDDSRLRTPGGFLRQPGGRGGASVPRSLRIIGGRTVVGTSPVLTAADIAGAVQVSRCTTLRCTPGWGRWTKGRLGQARPVQRRREGEPERPEWTTHRPGDRRCPGSG
jgi:hypothetical protein